MNLIIEGLIREGKELKFERKSGFGTNPDVLKLSNGDEVQIVGMSYKDKGTKPKKLKLDDTMDQHYTEQFILKGVGGKPYIVTREVTLYKRDANVKGGLFQSKIISVKEE